MYKQTATTDNYEVNASHKNTDKTKLIAGDTLEQGISYWIIVDDNDAQQKTVTIDKTLSGLAPTGTQDANSSDVNISDPDFMQVAKMQLPNNKMEKGGESKKYMAGNPFPYAFDLSNLYFKHYTASSNTFYPMGDTANNGAYINATVYKHDSSETGPSTGYEAVTPSTPGFNAPIQPMEGFFIKLKKENTDNGINTFAYPLTYGNDK